MRPFSALVLLLLACLTASAQTTFKQSFRNVTMPVTTVSGLVQTTDSLIYAVGYRSPDPYTTANEIAMLTVLKADGTILWSKDYKPNGIPGFNNLDFNKITQLPDGNLVVSMQSKKKVFGDFEAGRGLVCLNKNGEVQWTTYVDANDEVFSILNEINAVPNGYLLSGRKSRVVNNIYQHVYYCVKVDAQGNPMPGPVNNRYFKPTIGVFDVITANTDQQGNWYAMAQAITNKVSWIKFAEGSATPEWFKQIVFQDVNNFFSCILPLANGKVLLAGNEYNDNNDANGLLVMANADGTIDWMKSYHSPSQGIGFSQVIPTAGGFLIGDFYGLVVAVDNAGEVQWAYRHITQPGNESFISSLAPAIDGGYILGGDFNKNYTIFNGQVIKMGADGTVKDCCSKAVDITVSPVPFTIENNSYVMVNDSVQVVPWPMTVTASNISSRSLCAPTTFALTDSTVCTGGCLDISLSQLPVGSKAEWTVSSQVTVDPGNGKDQLCFNREGTETIILQPRLSDGCLPPPYTLSVDVRNTSEPLAMALTDSLFCPGSCTTILLDSLSTATISLSGGTVSSSNPAQICYPTAGNYTISATQMREGCLRTNTIPVTVQNLIDEVPNAFTPNGDDANDRFRPLLDCVPDTYLFRIFDRWGNLVFETTDPEGAWDGSFRNAPAPLDSYIWTVQSSDPLKVFKGEVVLLR